METARTSHRPKLGWTLGDVAGIGPELVVKIWSDPSLHRSSIPLVYGSAEVLRRTAREAGQSIEIVEFDRSDADRSAEASGPALLPCLRVATEEVADVPPGRVDRRAGRAAYDYLVAAIEDALAGRIDGIVTLPLNKEGLHAAGLDYPGHTEILAEKTGTRDFGMMLYRRGLGVLHVTLHDSLRHAITEITTERIATKIRLADQMMRRLGVRRPRIAVAALNPHASDGGLFGQEEAKIIAPAVEEGKRDGIDVCGPWPADTLFVRAAAGEFDGVVAMYHDQGHIALKLLGWREAVNITVGLPIVRVSVAHGTGYDIVGTGQSDPTSLREAVGVAVLLCKHA